MLNAEAIDRIREYKAEVEIFGHSDTAFHVSARGAVPLKFPSREAAKLFSLTQLVNYIKLLTSDAELPEALALNVDSYLKVEMWSALEDENREIEVAAFTDFSSIFEAFPFGKQLNQEEFIINLMTKFESTESRDELLKFVSSVRSEKLSTSDDDGVSQIVATRAGVHLASETHVKNLWLLKTFKTFPEVEQPTIPYILRLHQRDNETPKFALYECDGGRWKVELTQVIREWLTNRLRSELADKADLVMVL